MSARIVDAAPSRACDSASERDAVTVLYLIDQLRGIGGAEAALLSIMRHLPRDRFRPLVATFQYAPDFPGADALRGALHVLPMRRAYDFTAVRAARALRRLIRTEHVQITHCFFETSELWGGPVAKASGCPVLISSRRDMGIQRTWKHRFAFRILGRVFDEVQTVSDAVRDLTIATDGLAADKVVTVHTGVTLEAGPRPITRADLRARLGLPADTPVIVTVANVRPVKGIEVLIRCAGHVCRSRPDAAFLIVGDTPYPEYLEEVRAEAARLGIADRVRFFGPERNVMSLLGATDVFALLSHSEGFSKAVVEAMAAGLPCVVSRVGGNAEAVIDGVSGYVVPDGADDVAAARITALLDDAELRRRMSQAAAERARSCFTTEAMIRRLTSRYETLLHR